MSIEAIADAFFAAIEHGAIDPLNRLYDGIAQAQGIRKAAFA